MADPIVIPIPIREDAVVQVQIPPNLTHAEAEKVARIIMAYVLPNGELCAECKRLRALTDNVY